MPFLAVEYVNVGDPKAEVVNDGLEGGVIVNDNWVCVSEMVFPRAETPELGNTSPYRLVGDEIVVSTESSGLPAD